MRFSKVNHIIWSNINTFSKFSFKLTKKDILVKYEIQSQTNWVKVANHLVVLVYLQDNLLVGQPTTLSCRTNFVRIFYTSIIQTCFQQMAMMICLIPNRFNMIDIYTNWHLIFVQCYNSTLRVCRVNHAFFRVNHISLYNVNKYGKFSS